MIKDIPMADVSLDVNLQHRPAMDEETISRYKALIEDGCKFPPIDVVYDGKTYWVWDGAHRYQSHRKLNKKYITANITEGTKHEAVYYSFNANSTHGLPRQKGAIEKIIRQIMADEEWSKDSNVAIAKHVGCTETAVRYFKDKIAGEKAEKATNKTENNKTSKSSRGNPASDAENADSKSSKKPDPDSNAKNEGTENTSDSLKTPLLDSVGEIIPDHLVPVFSRVNEIKTLIHQLNQILKIAKDGMANKDLLWSHCKLNNLEIEMRNAKEVLKFTIPYAVCRFCMGEAKDCRGCQELGFQNESQYRAVPSELKKQK